MGYYGNMAAGENTPIRRDVLVVDDEAAIRRLLRVTLEKAGHVVRAASNGKEAWDLLHVKRPDYVILDIVMPHVDGNEFLEKLRAVPEFDDLPVFILTTKDTDTDVFEGYRRGADLYFTKPFDPADLVRHIQ